MLRDSISNQKHTTRAKKAGIKLTEGNESGDVTFKSLDVPLLLGTRIGLGPVGFRLQAGPVFSFAQKEKLTISNVTNFDDYKKHRQELSVVSVLTSVNSRLIYVTNMVFRT